MLLGSQLFLNVRLKHESSGECCQSQWKGSHKGSFWPALVVCETASCTWIAFPTHRDIGTSATWMAHRRVNGARTALTMLITTVTLETQVTEDSFFAVRADASGGT
mmetsp:Transcript_4230/g.5904  ORF Transcript_4230/g.5904 Transcript_4230/m.5904 type:complete len:106 (-) Transcript_4230:83-400(-)